MWGHWSRHNLKSTAFVDCFCGHPLSAVSEFEEGITAERESPQRGNHRREGKTAEAILCLNRKDVLIEVGLFRDQ